MSFKFADGQELQIQLTKAQKVINHLTAHYFQRSSKRNAFVTALIQLCLQQGETWRSALAGHELQAMDASADQKQLLLERFQNEVSQCQQEDSARFSPCSSQEPQLLSCLDMQMPRNIVPTQGASVRKTGFLSLAHHRLLKSEGSKCSSAFQMWPLKVNRANRVLKVTLGLAKSSLIAFLGSCHTYSRSLMGLQFCLQHPGFDFSSAEISGEAPNARTFMGGYTQ